jgi:hypothetical protein
VKAPVEPEVWKAFAFRVRVRKKIGIPLFEIRLKGGMARELIFPVHNF